jgi:N6-L-threonylcarbamoyladenine synthase
MRVLAIDTSCDDTAAAVVLDGRKALSDIVSSQNPIHQKYGGVVPELASRKHIEMIVPIVDEALEAADVKLKEIDGIAVTQGPGLIGSLLVGLSFAKSLAFATEIPLVGVNHIEAHLSAIFLEEKPPRFPFIGLVVSGGHTSLFRVNGFGDYRILGRTRDDAAGEAFDKAARILGLGYPGGPAIEQASRSGTPSLPLPRAWLKDSHDFSFSGLKTALWHLVHSGEVSVADAAASFQLAVADVLVAKTIEAAGQLQVEQILLSGGVAANKMLTQQFLASSPVPVLIPPPHLCTDNAAMVAACGYYHFQAGRISGYDLDVVPSLALG